MKKALAIISAVALVSAVAFAEDGLKISGQIETGIQTYSGDGADYVKLWETDAPGATRLDLDVAYTAGDTGLAFKLRSADGTTAPSVNYFHVWANLFSNAATVVAGNLDNNAWKTDADSDFTSENGYGVQLQLKPVAGLNLGVKVNTANPADVSAKTASDYNWKQAMNELGFGAKYATDKLAIAAGYKLDSDADSTTSYYGIATATPAALGTKAEDDAMAYAGINYFGIDKLKIQTEAKWEGLGAYSDIGLMTADEVIEYAVDAKTNAGIVMYQWVPGNSDAKTSLQFKPYANYKLSDVTLVKAEVGYKLNAGYEKNVNNFWICPGAEFQVAPKAQIRTDYTYAVNDTGDKSSAGKTTGHTFNLGFRYSF